jgi:hypothetical protein
LTAALELVKSFVMVKITKQPAKSLTAPRPVESLIHFIPSQKVMLDSDLAALYGVPTKSLNLAVRRNHSRFPEDFMFQLNKEETVALRFQTETSNKGRGGRRYLPYAFTEQGVAMLSSVLQGERAAQMNVAIMRAFVRLRQIIASNKDLGARIEKLERGHERTASVIEIIVEDIDRIAREVEV